MEHITTMMTALQQDLQKQHDVLAANLDPINSPRVAESIRKLKAALQELHTRNAQLTMRNERLNLQLSYIPPDMWAKIADTPRDHVYHHQNQSEERSSLSSTNPWLIHVHTK
jgi:hypothetical protein